MSVALSLSDFLWIILFMTIALLTDFGTKDYFVGAMKGAILSIDKNAQIIDISHEIEPQNIKSASFVLQSCFENFPKKTIFVAVVDPGVGSRRRAVLVESEKYFFIAPDNGLLSFVFENSENIRVFELTNKEFFAVTISDTFHGRDIFAPVAAHLSKGVSMERFGAQINDFSLLRLSEPRAISDRIFAAEIIHIDRFGNLVTNLQRNNLPESFAIEIGGTRINRICRFYAEGDENELILIFGSSGRLEISAVNNSAAEILRINRNSKILVKPI